MTSDSTLLQLYEAIPYPGNRLLSDQPQSVNELLTANYTTAQYVRTGQYIETEAITCLNAGCGAGWETLVLAEANPGAESIVGIDVSPRSLQVAEQRLHYHGYTNAKFYQMDLLKLQSLGQHFDLISCTDVLHFMDDPVAALKVLKSVLKPNGILRANFHCYYARRSTLELQEIASILGMIEQPHAVAIQQFRALMNSLIPKVQRRLGWNTTVEDERLLNSYLLPKDQGFSMPQVMTFLAEAGMGVVSLVDQPIWTIDAAFTSIPEFVSQQWQTMNAVEQLHLTELIYPDTHRLIDFWAEHYGSSLKLPWSSDDWMTGSVQFNPVLLNANLNILRTLEATLQNHETLEISWLGSATGTLRITPDKLAWLTPLFRGPVAVTDLVGFIKQQAVNTDLSLEVDILPYLQALEDFLFILLRYD